MKGLISPALFCALVLVGAARADTSVVFNEIMYHPATNEPALEWVELYNQMAVDVDISGWSLEGGVHYTFRPGTIVHGSSYLVVASSPQQLAAATGLPNIQGPFSGRLNNGGDHITLRDNNGRLVNEVDYGVDGDWPVAPDGSGVSLAKRDPDTASGPADNWTFSVQVGGTPGRENFTTPDNSPSLAFNEVSAATNGDFWLELINYGPSTYSLTGYVLVCDGSTNHEYVFPSGASLAPNSYRVVTSTTIGFRPLPGDKLYLYPPGRNKVVDAVSVKNTTRGRWPEGLGPWLSPSTSTPGQENNFVFHDEIIINEIMYHHQLLPSTSNLPPQPSDEAWVELYNRSSHAVDLSGWKLTGGITYPFAPAQVLNANSYLVVAKDAAALRARYPGVNIVGDFSGQLSHNGDTILLEDPTGNPANRVHYYTAGRWPAYADGGGSSLELRDPNADNSQPQAWAASDESADSSWQTYRYRAVAQTGVGPEQWNDFLFGLLSGGECLIDDISVVESPTTQPVQFIANGNFEKGLTGWRLLGNHSQSRVELDPTTPGNHVLHVVATGAQEHMNNHIETTFPNKRKVTNGRLYEISFRAKWLAGNNLLNTRLYFNRAAQTTELPTPQLNGTPGMRNSRYVSNMGPTISQLQHRPTVPQSRAPVTVSVVAQDPNGVNSCAVWWATNGGAFFHAAMSPQGDGLFTGTIPGYPAGTLVQFYVQATDQLGVVTTNPAAGRFSGAFYRVADGQANLSLGHNFRLLLTPANWALLQADHNLMSNDTLPCTLIYDEQRAYYDLGLRLKGSLLGRYHAPRSSFHLEFQPDDLFRGVHPVLLLDCSGAAGSANQQEEILVYHMMLHAGGIPFPQPDLGRVLPPFGTGTGPAVVLARHEDEFLETAYDKGGQGNLWLMELTYYMTTTNLYGYKLPPNSLLMEEDITDLGDDKETYRYNFILRNHHNADDYSRFIPFAKTLSLPSGPLLQGQTQQVMDVDEWLRVFAMVSLCGESDWYTFGHNHNVILYERPTDHKVVAFPWDVEQLFKQPATSPLIGNQNWSKVANLPANTRRLYAHVLDILNSTYNIGYMTYWVDHYSSFTPGQDFSDLLTYIQLRTSAVLSEINDAGGNAAFTLNRTSFNLTANNLVTLSGTAPVQVQSLRINGVDYPLSCSTVSQWTVQVPVSSPTSRLTIIGCDLYGNPLTNYSGTVTVNYTGSLPNPVGSVVINEIGYNPAVPGASFVELRNTSPNLSFDLSNWRLNGVDYTFPSGSILTNGQHLLLVKDQDAFLNVYGTSLVPFDEFTGILQADGETLTLLMPGAQTNQDVVVDKVRYATAQPWPATTPGISLQLIDPTQDHCRVANWAAAQATPGAPNSVGATLPQFPALWLNELQAVNVTGITNSAGQRTPWLELYNRGSNTLSLAGLYLAPDYNHPTAWAFPSGAQIRPGEFKVVFVDGHPQLSSATELHTSFSLSNRLGSVVLSRLYQGQAQVLDYLDYTNLAPNHSYGSLPDGQNFDRQEFFYVTPAKRNDGRSAPLTVTINEWMAGNTNTLPDPVTGKFEDWFELYNYGTNTADLAGYYLTHELTNQFEFKIPPGYTIPPRGFLLVWADKKATNGTPDLHVNFKLSKSGTSIGLYGADGQPVDYVSFGAQTSNISMGRYPDGTTSLCFMPTPTPRTNNFLPNTAPVLDPIADKVIYAGQTLRFRATATDAESSFQSLAFSLQSGGLPGASITPATGQFTWSATNVAVPSQRTCTIRVTDNGTPPLSDQRSFAVSVAPVPQFSSTKPRGTKLPLSFSILAGQTYQVQYKNNLNEAIWTPLQAPQSGTGALITVEDDMTGHGERFYRLVIGP